MSENENPFEVDSETAKQMLQDLMSEAKENNPDYQQFVKNQEELHTKMETLDNTTTPDSEKSVTLWIGINEPTADVRFAMFKGIAHNLSEEEAAKVNTETLCLSRKATGQCHFGILSLHQHDDHAPPFGTYEEMGAYIVRVADEFRRKVEGLGFIANPWVMGINAIAN